MAKDQLYEKVADDESGDALMGEGRSSRVTRAPPSTPTKKTVLTKVALVAIALTVFLAITAVVSSVVVSFRLPAATEAALAKQSSTTKSSGMEMDMGDSDDTEDESASKSKETSTEITKVIDTSAVFDAKHHQDLRSCGSTPDEAREAGCVFDVMMQLWTPPECMDSPLAERFLEAGNWTWWADSGATRAYTNEEIRKGNHDVVYVAQSYHRHHCIFAWERLVRAMRNQGPLIQELISYDHVMHCRHKTLTMPEEGAEVVRGVVAPTGYTRCASYDVWINDLPFNKMSSSE